MRLLLIIFITSCSSTNYRKLANHYDDKLNVNCYSSVLNIFKIKKKITVDEYEYELSKFLQRYSSQEEALFQYHFQQLEEIGYPSNVSKRIALKSPETAKRIITSKYGTNTIQKAYRGMSLSSYRPSLYASPDSSQRLFEGDYYSKSFSTVRKSYANNSTILSTGDKIILESHIPLTYTDKGFGLIKQSFVMTHPDSTLFIHRVKFIDSKNKESGWYSLEEAVEKGLLYIID